MDIAWSDDSKKLVAVGAGSQRAAAINVDSGTRIGDMTGANGTLLTCDIKLTKPPKCIASGEDMEVQVFKGIPYRHDCGLPKKHTGFINKLAFSKTDQGAHFVSASGDKTITVYNTESNEALFNVSSEHS